MRTSPPEHTISCPRPLPCLTFHLAEHVSDNGKSTAACWTYILPIIKLKDHLLRELVHAPTLFFRLIA